MGYLGADEPAIEAADTDALVLRRVDLRTAEIVQRQKDEESRRKWTLLITIGGALFAAVRLGIIALPAIKQRRARALELAAPAPAKNPRRRR